MNISLAVAIDLPKSETNRWCVNIYGMLIGILLKLIEIENNIKIYSGDSHRKHSERARTTKRAMVNKQSKMKFQLRAERINAPCNSLARSLMEQNDTA